MTNVSEPLLVSQVHFSDDRGDVMHYGAQTLGSVARIYFIRPKLEAGFRGWHGHRFESKIFRCVTGSFVVASVRVTDWSGNPFQAEPQSWTLSAITGDLLIVPEGFANGILPLEEGSSLMVMSNRTLSESQGDDLRFPPEYFPVPKAS